MTKAEKIKEAYGEHWEAVKDYVDENGKINTSTLERSFFDKNLKDFLRENRRLFDFKTLFIGHLYTLISLRGIENNNGWSRFDENIPKESSTTQQYQIGKFINEDDFYILDRPIGQYELSLKAKDGFTHYKLIPPPVPPLY